MSSAEMRDPAAAHAYPSSHSRCHRGGEDSAWMYWSLSCGGANSVGFAAGKKEVGLSA